MLLKNITGIEIATDCDSTPYLSMYIMQIIVSLEDEKPIVITAWTEHNGYYSHEVIVSWNLNINGKNEIMNKNVDL
jgi:hypothetical protein